MSKHTPGPWSKLLAHRGYIITAKKGIYDVAVVRDIGNEDNEANARLIAAAPELLEALQVIVANANGRPMQTGYYDVPAGSIDAARTIIAKATGAAE